MSRITVVYLSGFGRSGSTLVERMLGAAPGWVNVGELVDLARSVARADELCGCGEPFSRCPVWTQVGEAAFGGWTDRRAGPAGPCCSALPPASGTCRPPGPATSCRPVLWSSCGTAYARIYRAVAEVTGCHRRRRCLQGSGPRRRARRRPRRRPADAQRRPRPAGSRLVVASPRRPSARHLRHRGDVADPGAPVRGAVECAPAGGGRPSRTLGRVPVRPSSLRGLRGRPGRGPWSPRPAALGVPLPSCRPARSTGGEVVLGPATDCPATPGDSGPGAVPVAAATTGGSPEMPARRPGRRHRAHAAPPARPTATPRPRHHRPAVPLGERPSWSSS